MGRKRIDEKLKKVTVTIAIHQYIIDYFKNNNLSLSKIVNLFLVNFIKNRDKK